MKKKNFGASRKESENMNQGEASQPIIQRTNQNSNQIHVHTAKLIPL